MRLKTIYEQISEAKSVGKLYHFTTIPALISILIDDTIDGPVSLTRNKEFGKQTKIIPSEVKITLDGNKLSNNHKIKPISYGYEKDVVRMVGHTLPNFEDQMEERIDKSVKNATDYILEIEVNEIDIWDYLDEDNIDKLDKLAYELGKNKDDLSYNDIEEFLLDRGIKIV